MGSSGIQARDADQGVTPPRDPHPASFGSEGLVHREMDKPFLVSCAVEWFCEQIGRVFDAGYMVDIDEAMVHGITNEVGMDVDVLHS